MFTIITHNKFIQNVFKENAYLNILYILDHEMKLSTLLGTPFDINIDNFFMRRINEKIKY